MKEQIPFDFEGKDKEAKEEKRPYKSEEEKLAEIRARAKNAGVKGFEPVHPRIVDDHKKRYSNER